MKKYYLPFMCLGLFSSVVFSQNTYVTGPAKIKVQPNTLFYNGGDFHVKEAVEDDGTILNDGNIRINGSFINERSLGKNFISTYSSANSYGQVIISDDNQTLLNGTLNRLTMEKNTIDPQTSAWGQFAIPYQYSNIGQAFSGFFGISYINGPARYNFSAMRWNNFGRPEFYQRGSWDTYAPTEYLILNLTNHPELINVMNNNDILQYPGVPANGVYTVSYDLGIYPNEPWSIWKNRRNGFNEAYSTYIGDSFRNEATDPNYGKYAFQFGNPYTSNIDLSKLNTAEFSDNRIENLLGVSKYIENYWNSNDGVVHVSSVEVKATYEGGQWAGNAEALIVKPFEPFVITLTDDAPRTQRTFTFDDRLKTFSQIPANPGDTEFDRISGTGSNGIYVTNGTNDIVSNGFYQLGLFLYNEEGQKTGNHAYVVVDANSETGVAQALEAEYADFTNGFFLTQENAEGTEITVPNRTMQINVVNPTYVSKPIPLFYKQPTSELNGYYLKSELFFNNIFNKLNPEEELNFADGNSFFFYDKTQDILLPITSDFSYYIDRPESELESRYVVYWNGGPQNEDGGLGVSDELAGKTQVYKDGELHKIRFDKNWNTADIAVYDMAGRSIFKKKNVKTDVDFTLDLPNTMVYVVKIQSNTGETVTTKILR